MWIKLLLLIAFSLAMIIFGILWFAKSFSSKERYDFKEDFIKTFFTIHRSYEAFFNDNMPRRIVPLLIILGGSGLLLYGIIKLV